MSLRKIILMFLILIPATLYGMDDLDNFLAEINISAQQDISGFKSKLSVSFGVDVAKVESVLSVSEKPADAYMIFRISEIAQKPVSEVTTVYIKNKNQGWGKIAKDLGIKPGSKEFKELKKGKLTDNADDKKKDKPKKGKGHDKK